MLYSVCAPAVFEGKPIGEVLPIVAAAGFKYYEFWKWWESDMDEYLEAQTKAGLNVAALCTPFISLTDPAYRADYVEGLKKTVEICGKMGCKTIISQVGQDNEGMTAEEQHASIVDGVKECVPYLEAGGVTLVIEPLNTINDHPGYYLWKSEEAFQIVDEIGSPNVKVCYDLYHQYTMDDLCLEKIGANIDKIGHFHVAGFPGRHEPMVNCEIDYPAVLSAIRGFGYKGTIGMEYWPVNDPAEGVMELGKLLQNI